MSRSVAAGLFIILLLAISGAWMWYRGGRRLITWPVMLLFGGLGAVAIALILGW